MAIGLTVDFTAHVSYRCFSGDPNESRVEKVAHGIEMIAFPTALVAYLLFYFNSFTFTILPSFNRMIIQLYPGKQEADDVAIAGQDGF